MPVMPLARGTVSWHSRKRPGLDSAAIGAGPLTPAAPSHPPCTPHLRAAPPSQRPAHLRFLLLLLLLLLQR